MSKKELDALLDDLPAIIAGSGVVCVSGSLPSGAAADTYQHIVALCKRTGKKVILDSSGTALELGILARPTMIKPNQDEIETLCKTTAASHDDVVRCAQSLHSRGIENVVISLGGKGVFLACNEGAFEATPPKIKVENTVGCGDSMADAFAVALERSMAPREALAHAVSVATAAAMSPHTGQFQENCAHLYLCSYLITNQYFCAFLKSGLATELTCVSRHLRALFRKRASQSEANCILAPNSIYLTGMNSC